MKKVIVTGAAGFIGFHISKRLIDLGYIVLGIDNLSDYYDKNLKLDRLDKLNNKNFKFIKMDIQDYDRVLEAFYTFKPDMCINLAAQAGIDYSFENPRSYIDTNITGFFNILEACRKTSVNKLLYASSSSIYGNNKELPFLEDHDTSRPLSLYSVTKKTNELLAYSYSQSYGLCTIGLRFFTVYGSWGRPDMSIFKFTQSIINGEKVKIYGDGDTYRDFTHINDIVDSICYLINKSMDNNYEVFNIGNESPISLLEMLEVIEKKLNMQANITYLPSKTGDIPRTFSNSHKLYSKTNFKPTIKLDEGIDDFLVWYKEYYIGKQNINVNV
ncbi:SDR family NAD(P)-dependent oxidoreductase [Mammaliicoccus sp. I-M36]|uniref:SDR family NAD(P)-dependent oxidoreductase n=1 Tax=Mammaliicoccus sp. I-M36 TaxID=2898695 RepID=UPI001EFA7950|nr:SDR family NAD(P)-dependent oxidoreductase [Mammaliicoccus sp. I-M36]